jgi:serine/threonine protein kinase
MGLFLYEILLGRLPFKGKTLHDTYSNILQNNPDFSSPISPECQDLILGLLQKEPHNRLNMTQIFSHKWIMKHIGEYDTSFLIDRKFEMNKTSLATMLERIYDIDDIHFLFLFGEGAQAHAHVQGKVSMEPELETPKRVGRKISNQETSEAGGLLKNY